MYYFNFGILILTVFFLGHASSSCKKEVSQKIFNEIKQKFMSEGSEYILLYQNMKREDEKFKQYLYFCEEDENLFDKWDKLENDLLNSIKKSCPNFENSFEEMNQCRQTLDIYSLNQDQTLYCSNLKKCTEMHQGFCAPLKELVLLDNPMSNASAHFCTIDCDNIPGMRKILRNCWASTQIQENSFLFEPFSACVLANINPTCRITRKILLYIFPLFSNKIQMINSEEITPKPESKCIQTWKALKDIENLDSNKCKTLEDIKPCITKFLKRNQKLYQQKLAKCHYTEVNLIKMETNSRTERATTTPSNAAGKIGSGAYHSAVICWLVTMFHCYFSNII